MNTQIHTSTIKCFYHHLNRFYANPLSILLSLAAGFIVVLLNNDMPHSSVRGWGTSEIDTILKLGLLFNLLMLLGSWWVVTARPKNYDIIEPKIKPLVDTMNNTGLIQTIASCEGHSLPGKPPYVYFRSTVEFAAQLEKLLRANLSHPKMRALWCIEGNFNQEEELVFTLFSPVYHSRLYALRHTVEFWLFRKQVDEELLLLAQLVNKAAESYTGARLKDIEHPPVAFDYQSGYIEMRNMTAFILNIVAGEIDDGSLRVDGDMAWYTQAAIDNNDPRIEQQKKKARQALSITHTLLKRSAPVSLRQHDKLLDIYLLCLNAITSQEGKRKVFVDHSETLDDIRCPPELFDEYEQAENKISSKEPEEIIIEITQKIDSDGCAFLGEFDRASFKVIEYPKGKHLTADLMQKLLHQWCFDCQLEQFGKKPTNDSFRGQMVFIDQEAPEEGERINLILG